MATIKHAKTATGANDPTKQISVDAWNAGHVIENLIISDVSGLQAALDAKQASNANLTSVAGLSLSGTAGHVVTVNAGATGFELVAGGGGVTSVSGNAPIVSSGGATPAISITAASTAAAGSMSAADKTKLDGVASGATANSSDATLLARGNHTGTQAPSTINFTASARFLGRNTAGAGIGEELTGSQATLLLDPFTSTLRGVAPASGGGTSNFLRADGSWASPPTGSVSFAGSPRIYGRTTAGAGAGEELTGTQVTALLDVFATSAKGLVPSPAGTTNTTDFLRRDGTWAAPAGGSSGWTLIATATGDSSATSAAFGSIPTTYSDLMLEFKGLTLASTSALHIALSPDNGTTLSGTQNFGWIATNQTVFDGAVFIPRYRGDIVTLFPDMIGTAAALANNASASVRLDSMATVVFRHDGGINWLRIGNPGGSCSRQARSSCSAGRRVGALGQSESADERNALRCRHLRFSPVRCRAQRRTVVRGASAGTNLDARSSCNRDLGVMDPLGCHNPNCPYCPPKPDRKSGG